VGERSKLRVRIEFGEAKADLEGDVDQVTEAAIRFLTQVYPNLEIVQRIVYTPDLARITQELVGIVQITSEGSMIALKLELPTRDAICLALLGSHVGNWLRKLPKATLSSNELARITRKKPKTISNEVPRLIAEGLAERTTEGEYQITTSGIRRTEEMIRKLTQKQPKDSLSI